MSGPAARPPLERLRARIATLGAPLCLGIDPHPDRLPEGLAHDVRGVETFARGLLEAAAPAAAAIKVNAAFFEAFGSAGWAALERLCADVPADHVLIIDAKRGDLASTAERYAEGLLGHLGADGVTLSPYLGEDAIEPFRVFPNRLLYVLTRTSNPSAPRFQHLVVDGTEPLAEHVGAWVAERWPVPEVGLVVGATAPDELRAMRERLPGPAFLVPGIGAQGGDLAAAVAAARGEMAPGIVNVSRAIADAARGDDWQRAAAAAAETWRASMAESGATLAH